MEAKTEVELSEITNPLVEVARSFQVTDDYQYGEAMEQVAYIKGQKKMLDDERTDLVKPLNDTVKKINDRYRAPISACDEAEKILKKSCVVYVDAKEALAKKAREEAQALADAEHAKAVAEAEANGEDATMLVSVVVETEQEAPKVAGTSVKKTWVATVNNKMDLIKFVVANPAFENLLEVDNSALQKMVKAMGSSFNIGGCSAKQETSLSSRSL